MVNTINPGSYTRQHKIEDNHFMYAFVALNASIKGWEYCMPTIVVDGTFLKSAYRGTMLCASVLDVEGKILPLAYSIVDSENDASWEWFFSMFKIAYERENMSIVSNRNESILKVAAKVYPNETHCICIYHLWNNIKGKFKRNQKELKGIFFTMACTYVKEDFDRLSEDANKIDERVMAFTSHVYVVIDEIQKQSILCMREKRCSCLQFQVDEMLCPHAMEVLSYTHMNVQSYCVAYYTKENYLKAYEFSIIPLPDESMWHIPTEVLDIKVLPPIWKSRPGRPRNSNRGKGIMDYMSAQKVSYVWCGKVGHNQRTYANDPTRI
ncbi:hypothetical protein P3S67_013409 [Capsicum chacoense]